MTSQSPASITEPYPLQQLPGIIELGIERQDKAAALTNFFNGAVGAPSRTIIWGNSLGGAVALKLVEECVLAFEAENGLRERILHHSAS